MLFTFSNIAANSAKDLRAIEGPKATRDLQLNSRHAKIILALIGKEVYFILRQKALIFFLKIT